MLRHVSFYPSVRLTEFFFHKSTVVYQNALQNRSGTFFQGNNGLSPWKYVKKVKTTGSIHPATSLVFVDDDVILGMYGL